MANLVKFSHHLYLNCYYPLNFPGVLNCLERRRIWLQTFSPANQLTITYITNTNSAIVLNELLYLLVLIKMITLKEQTGIEMFFLPTGLQKGQKKYLESYLTLNGIWAQGRVSVFIVSCHTPTISSFVS